MKDTFSNKVTLLILVGFFALFVTVKGCRLLFGLWDVGGHGSIKGYQYSVTKYVLEDAIDSFLGNSNVVRRDTNYYYYVLNDSVTGNYRSSTDSIEGSTRVPEYYNDGINYLSIHISKESSRYDYIIRYYGASKYWDMAKQSEIFIAYAHDGRGNGGSDGNGGFDGKEEIKQELITVFEKEFIGKLDKQLGITHTESD